MSKGIREKYGNLECVRGNAKIAADTLIFNMGPAFCCPSYITHQCSLCNKLDPILGPQSGCYARHPEVHRPRALTYRQRQAHYWINTPHSIISQDFIDLIQRKRVVIEYLRWNESGDFHSQDCVDKLIKISARVYGLTGVKSYLYTARQDLDYSDLSPNNLALTIKGSGWDGPNGRTTVYLPWESCPDGYHDCPGNCRVCNVCKHGNRNIAFKFHSGRAIMNKLWKLHREGRV
jgi:hypothetical protein